MLLLKLVFVPSRCLQILPPTLCRGWGLPPLYLCPSFSSWDTQELSQRRTGHNEVSCAVLVCAASVPAGHPTPLPSHPAAGLPGMYFFSPKGPRVCMHSSLQGDSSLLSFLMWLCTLLQQLNLAPGISCSWRCPHLSDKPCPKGLLGHRGWDPDFHPPQLCPCPELSRVYWAARAVGRG